MNTPNKRVEEIKTKFAKDINLMPIEEALDQALTQHHQDMMKEVVERIENFDHNDNHLCRFNDAPQKCECYYGGIEIAQTIIKSK